MSVFTTLQHKFNRASALCRKFGLWAAIQHTINQVGDTLCSFEATTIVRLVPANLSIALDLPEDTEMRFLSPTEVEHFARNPENDLSTSLVQRAFAETDLCFAGLVNGRLASYGWYSLAPEVSADDFGLMMRVPTNCAYMYSGFTHPDFRGRRLHGLGMGLALGALSDRGIDALLSDVDWANHASLRSCWRLGYQNLGNLYTFGRSRFRVALSPKAARTFGVSFQREATNCEKQSTPKQNVNHLPTEDSLVDGGVRTGARQTCP